ncbi:unnamed protein product [Brassica rapa subsp. trilocularis]
MGYVLRVRMASFFAGAATASFIGLSVLYKDYKVAHESISQQLISSNHRNKLRSSFWDTLRSYGAEPPEDWSSTPTTPSSFERFSSKQHRSSF